LVKEKVLLSTFGGIYDMLAKQVLYTMAKQVSFDVFAELLYSILAAKAANLSAEDVKWSISVTVTFIVSLYVCFFSQPDDMIMTETYKGSNDRGVFGIVGNIYKAKGVADLFMGTQSRIMHVGTIITSQLVVYDTVKEMLGLQATGSH
jgi:solute carrier family 25 phosphate transporter 3